MAEAQENPSISPGGIIRSSHVYKMNHAQRGKALIFVHREYASHLNLKHRGDTSIDVNRLKRAFKNLRFDVQEPYTDLTKNEIETVLNEESQNDHTDCDCLVVIVLTHGLRGALAAYDDIYPQECLWKPFTADRCPTLIGKPKLFFIQACRGKLEDSGVELIPHNPNAFREQRRTSAIQEFDDDYGPSLFEVENDFLVAFATVYDFVSWRKKQTVSVFMKYLCEELQKLPYYDNDEHILHILQNVNQRVVLDYKSNPDERKQIPCVTHRLTKLLYFFTLINDNNN